MPMRRLNSPALLIASCPVMASATYSRSDGAVASLMATSSVISSSSMCSRPAVSTMTTSNPRLAASASGALRARDGIHLPRRVVHPDRRLLTDDVQLLDGRRTLHVGGDEQRMPSLLRQPFRQLARRRRLAGALQPEQQDDARPPARRLQPSLGVAEEGHHFVADDLDDLLRGGEAPGHVLAHRAIPDPVDERLDDLEVDVGFEQREPNLAQRGLDVLRRQPRFAPERLEHVLETCAEGLEHGPLTHSTANAYRNEGTGSRLSNRATACAPVFPSSSSDTAGSSRTQESPAAATR